jgi:hypothetical protein
MRNLLDRIVTPKFIAFNAHCWFACSVVFVFPSILTLLLIPLLAGVKEFYVDKHFEEGQTFRDNLLDWIGYVTGEILALVAIFYL